MISTGPGCSRNPEALKPKSTPAVSPKPEPDPEQQRAEREAQEHARILETVRAASGSQSTSVGDVLGGQLHGGLRLPKKAPGMIHNPGKNIERAYGTVEVVQALVRAAKSLAQRPADEHIVINDLSFAKGGPIEGHSSHRAGRDVDFYFPLRDAQNQPYPSKLIPLDQKGQGADYFDLQDPSDDVPVHIDLERTWDYLAALLSDSHAFIQRIFVVEHLQQAIAKHARQRGADPQLLARFVEVSCQPRKAPHDDHVHIRFYCSFEDLAAGCLDSPPIDAIHQARLDKAGVKARVAGKVAGDYTKQNPRAKNKKLARKSRPKPKITSAEQARAKAGAMHESVSAFLDARKAWTKRRPGPQARCR